MSRRLNLLITGFTVLMLSAPPCAAVTHNSPLFEFELPHDPDEKPIKVKMLPYDADIYDLAYTTYLKNNNPKDAFTVALAAVRQKPRHLMWHERLAQVAIWNARPLIASKQYLYLAKRGSLTALAKGRKLASSMQDDKALEAFILLDLSMGHYSSRNWKDYTETLLRLGKINLLLRKLDLNTQHVSKSFHLLTISRIFHLQDNPTQELTILKQYVNQIGLTPAIAKQLAEIYMNLHQENAAFAVMLKAKHQAKTQDIDFWNVYTITANANKKYNEALYGYQQLVKQEKPELPIYINLLDLTFKNEPQLAYQYARKGRQLYPMSFGLTEDSFALLSIINRLRDFPTIWNSSPPLIKQTLNYNSSFWNARAQYFLEQNNLSEAIRSYLKGIAYIPKDDHLKSDFVSLLIEMDDKPDLMKVMSWWQACLVKHPSLWNVYAQGFSELSQPMMAKLVLNLFYEQFYQYQYNSNWLIMLKDNLDNAYLPRHAKVIADYTWPIFLSSLRQQKEPFDYYQLIDYVKLSMTEASGDPTGIALTMLQQHVDKDVSLLMLSWALTHNNFALAYKLYWLYRTQGIQPPQWIALQLALHRYDINWMRQILTNKKRIVSYRDKVRAAIAIEAIPLAQSIATQELKKHRKDQDLYDKIFTPVMLSTADSLLVSQDFYQYGSVLGPRTDISFTYFDTPGFSLTPYTSTWVTRTVAGKSTSTPGQPISATFNLQLAWAPPEDERAGIKLSIAQHRGKLDFDLGVRDNLTTFFTGKVSRSYKVFHDLDTITTLGLNQPADDTVSLLVGATENNIRFDFSHNMTVLDNINGTFLQKYFYTQNGQFLSQGSQGTLRLDHKLLKTAPDFTITPYGTIATYYDQTQAPITGTVTRIIPKGVPPTVGFFIPYNFTEYGITGSFGQSYIDDYTHRWQPFALFTLSKNSVVGVGELVNIGLAGAVFGRDHLLLYYEWGSNQGQGIQNVVLGKIAYRIYI